MKRRFRIRRLRSDHESVGEINHHIPEHTPGRLLSYQQKAHMHYQVLGRQEESAKTVFLSSGLGGLGSFWQPQLEALGARFKVIIYDQRGTGKSPADLPADYSIKAMAEDVAEIVDELGIQNMYFVGHALGGLVGIELALLRPQLIQRMVIINGWAQADSHTLRCFAVRKALLRNSGVAAYVQAQPIFLYPAPWLSVNAQRLENEELHAIAHFPSSENVLARINALSAFNPGTQIRSVLTHTLIYATKDDVLVPYTCSEKLAALLPNAALHLRDSGGHGCTVTEAEDFNNAAISFLHA